MKTRGGPHWNEWVSQYSGGDVAARKPGDGKLKPSADAPGTYVMVRSSGLRATAAPARARFALAIPA